MDRMDVVSPFCFLGCFDDSVKLWIAGGTESDTLDVPLAE